jgi:hypothetical protein
MKTTRRNLVFLTLLLSLPAAHAAVTFTATDTFSPSSGSNLGNLTITGDLSIYKGLDVGTTAVGALPASAINIDWYNTPLLPKTASFDLTDANATFQWRDNLAGGAAVRNKMTLNSDNVLSLYNATGAAAKITLNGTTGEINLNGIGSGILANGTRILFADNSGTVYFENAGWLRNTCPEPSSSPTTGAVTFAGGLGVLGAINTAQDSTFNGVRVGKGAGTGSGIIAGLQAGTDSIAVGNLALSSNQKGIWNTAIGSQALKLNNTGYLNTAVGFDALSSNLNGSCNSALGSGAGSNTSDASRSIFIGYKSSGSGLGNNSNSIVIGADAIGEGSNTTVIGNSMTTKTRLFGTLYSDKVDTTGLLAVGGATYLTRTALPLLNLPAGVTGSYYGPQRTGSNFYQHDFVFSKSGDEITGDFIVPLGNFSNTGGDITVDISTPSGDPDSGSAHFVLAGKRTTSASDPLIASEYQAFGGAADIELCGKSLAGSTSLFIKFNAKSVSPGQSTSHVVQVKVRYLGSVANPQDRSNTFESVYPIAKIDSTNRPNGGTTTRSITAAEIKLDGKVIISQPQGDISMGIYN